MDKNNRINNIDTWPRRGEKKKKKWKQVLQAVSMILAHNVIGVAIRSGLR